MVWSSESPSTKKRPLTVPCACLPSESERSGDGSWLRTDHEVLVLGQSSLWVRMLEEDHVEYVCLEVLGLAHHDQDGRVAHADDVLAHDNAATAY